MAYPIAWQLIRRELGENEWSMFRARSGTSFTFLSVLEYRSYLLIGHFPVSFSIFSVIVVAFFVRVERSERSQARLIRFARSFFSYLHRSLRGKWVSRLRWRFAAGCIQRSVHVIQAQWIQRARVTPSPLFIRFVTTFQVSRVLLVAVLFRRS